MNYEIIKKPIRCQTIWLNTEDAVADADRKYFTFNHLSLIQIRNRSLLKINSVTLSGAGVGSAPGHNWTIKLGNVKFNNTSYYNSDKDTLPTVAMINFDQNNSIQNGSFALELENQDINQIIVKITSDDGHGAIKNSQPVEFHICMVVEEFSE